MLKITIYPLQNADCFAVCPVIDLTWCECSDFGVPSQGFEDLHRPFGQLSAIWPAILCATVVVRRTVSKQRLPTGLWTLSRLLIRAKVWNAPFTLGSTQQGLSPPVRGWEVCLFRKYALQPAGLLRIPCQVLQAGRSVLGLLSAVGEWLIHVYATSIHMCLLPHTVITLCSPLCYCCCCLPCTQCSSSYTMYILLVYHHVLCWLLFNKLSLCSLLTMLLFLLLPCFSAQHTLLLTRYANFIYLGFRRSLAYLHLSAASPPSSIAICGNCVCVLSSLECNLYRLLVASLTVGLNIVPITENSPWCLVKAWEGTSPVTIVTSVPWEWERDITEVAVLAARPAKRRCVQYPVMVILSYLALLICCVVNLCSTTAVPQDYHRTFL